jgi:hypothetical protein
MLPVLLLLPAIYCQSQAGTEDWQISLPDTTLSLEGSLSMLEGKTGLYFSYNTEILDLAKEIRWQRGVYPLGDILENIGEKQNVKYAIVGNQVVFYRAGEEPGLALPLEDRDPGKILKISGQVLSALDHLPLEFATIWIPATWEGTIANANGFFRINLPGPYPPDTIAISCLGYASRKIPVSELNDSLNRIYLNPAIIPIQEVIIRRSEPLHLIRQALDRIEENYSSDPVIETAFYRESIQKSTRYVMVSEAVIDIFKPGGYLMDREQVRLLKGRKNMDIHETDTFMVKLKGGLQTSFMLDFIRYRPDFLDPDQFHLFQYKMADIVTVQDRNTYSIEFRQRPHTALPHYMGRIYIDMETMAFSGINLEVDPKTISRATHAMVLRKPRNVMVRPLSAKYRVNYKFDGQGFHLSLIRADVSFRIRPRKKLFGNEFRTISEMAVTKIQKEGAVRFKASETTNKTDIFADLVGGYDPEFWGPYNIIIPDESLEEAMKRISRLMGTNSGD